MAGLINLTLPGGGGGGGDTGNITFSSNTVSTSNVNGSIVLDPNGNGLVQVAGCAVQIVDSGLLVYTGGGDEKVQVAGGAGGTLLSSDTDIRWYNDADISSGTAGLALGRTSDNGLLVHTVSGGGGGSFVEMREMSDPAAPAADRARLFTRDNGSGKTQVCVRFPTGAVQVLATEP